MTSLASLSPLIPRTARALLRRLDHRIVALRRALAHDHRDAAHWEAFGIAASEAQAQRAVLRRVANLVHVERAAARERLHGFATLAEQTEWLARMATHRCPRAARFAGLPEDATLEKLRAGELVGAP